MRRDRVAPQDQHTMTQDFHLVQTLHEARRVAEAHVGEDPRWAALAARVDGIFERLDAGGGEPARRPRMGIERIDRTQLPSVAVAERVVSALTALGDRPDQAHLEQAGHALDELETAMR